MTANLPDAPWTKRPGLAALTEALGIENVRWVGGAIRDTLLGLEVADVDAATLHPPEKVQELCREAGLKTVPTGIDHGTITVVLPGGPVEVTTVRHDVATDGRRATVAFADNWRDDAARRDFTINALYARPDTLEIEDFFGGLADLEARRVAFIGDARTRIREDYLRILRYFRFQTRFGDRLDDEALAACTELAPTLKGLSRERVASELLALLSLPDPAPTVRLMFEQGILAHIVPETRSRQLDALARLVKQETAQGAKPNSVRRLAALLPPQPAISEAVAARLRLSKTQRSRLICAAERRDSDADNPRALAYELGTECARDRLLLGGSSIDKLRDWSVPQLPIKGRDIIARGVEPGPQVAKLVREVERQWIAREFPDRDGTLQIADELIAPR